MENNRKFTKDYKVIHAHIDHRTNNYTNLKGKVKDLQEVSIFREPSSIVVIIRQLL